MTDTSVSICNMALDLLVEAPITTLSDGTPESDWLNRNYDRTVKAELEEHPWKFALKRASLTADASAPTFDWLYRFALPTDCVRALPLRGNLGDFEGGEVPHEIEAGYILCDDPGPIKLIYIYLNQTVSTYPAMFEMAVAARLAMGLSHFLTGKASMTNTLQAIYADWIARARRTNAFQGAHERPDGLDVIGVRYGG